MAMFEIHAVDEQIKTLPTYKTASGSVATFETDMTENLISCIAEISASATKCYLANMSDITNKTYFEGLLNGTYGFVDLGMHTWTKTTNWGSSGDLTIFSLQANSRLLDAKGASGNDSLANIICPIFQVATRNQLYNSVVTNGINLTNQGYVQIVSTTEYADATAFQTAMSGVYLIYELATPTAPTITANDFNTLLSAFNISGWLFEYDFGETVSSGATLECVSGTLTRNDDSVKSVGGNILSVLSNNNIFASTGDAEVKYILSVGEALRQG